jgi:hypothetical protein
MKTLFDDTNARHLNDTLIILVRPGVGSESIDVDRAVYVDFVQFCFATDQLHDTVEGKHGSSTCCQ